MTTPIALDPRAAAAHGLRPARCFAPGTVIVAGDGRALRVTPAGTLDPWPPDGRRSIASDPAAVGRRRRA